MKISEIQPVSTWYDGTTVVADSLGLTINWDNMVNEAEFRYALLSNGEMVFTNYLLITGSDYQNWNGTNEEAVTWVTTALNITVV